MRRASRILTGLTSSIAIAGIAAGASAQTPPAPGADASAAAFTAPDRIPPGGNTGTLTDAGPVAASITATAGSPGFAEGHAESTVGGVLRSRSGVSGAYGSGGPSQASARASWVSQLVTTGTDPGAAIDLDFQLNIDGLLDIGHNNANPGDDDIRAEVGFDVTLFDDQGAILSGVFSGTAVLTVDSAAGSGMSLLRFGGWADAARDGDFQLTQATCGVFACSYDVSTNVSLADAGFVSFGQVFAVEVSLRTLAFLFNGFEVDASSDFSNTASVTLSTSTAGVSFATVPEPGTLGLCVLGLSLLGARRSDRRISPRYRLPRPA